MCGLNLHIYIPLYPSVVPTPSFYELLHPASVEGGASPGAFLTTHRRNKSPGVVGLSLGRREGMRWEHVRVLDAIACMRSPIAGEAVRRHINQRAVVMAAMVKDQSLRLH